MDTIPEVMDLADYVPEAEDRTVLVLVHGRVRSVPLGQMMAPAWLERDVRLDWSQPMAGEREVELLGHVAVILDRIHPGLACYVVPGMHRPGGRGLAGLQHPGGALLLAVQSGARPWQVYHTALHEAWHAVEARMTEADFEMVRRAVSAGTWLPEDGYNDSPQERAANCFAAWSCARLAVSPRPAAPAWSSDRSVEQVFAEVLAGTYGTHAAVKPSLLRLMVGDVWWLAGRTGKLMQSIYRSASHA